MSIGNSEYFIVALSKEGDNIRAYYSFTGDSTFAGQLEAREILATTHKVNVGGNMTVWDAYNSQYVNGITGDFDVRDANDALLRLRIINGVVVQLSSPI